MNHAPRDREIVGEASPSAATDRAIINREDAGTALRELFLANAARGDNAANDELVDELVRRIRARRPISDGGARRA